MPLRIMSFLAHQPARSSVESERWRMARFRMLVFAILTISALVLVGALIYNAERTALVGPGSATSGISNDPSVTSDP